MRIPSTVTACIAVLLITSITGPQLQAGGNSGWGWAKPLNKRMGAFYTSNKNANFSRSKQRSSNYRYVSPQRTYSAHQQRATQLSSPTVITLHQSGAPIVRHTVPRDAVPVLASPLKSTTPKPTSGQTTLPTTSQSPAGVRTSSGVSAGVLPHRSTTNHFWQ